jgi:hypothetical protein
MSSRFRKMRKYHPRRSSKEIKENKQKLITIENRIKSELGNLVILLKEGAVKQAHTRSLQVQDDLLKLGSDMEKLATNIGGSVPKKVSDFLHMFNTLILIAKNEKNLDESNLQSYNYAAHKLDRALLP